MELYHESDEPPYRKLDEHVRFKCAADDLMQTLAGRKASDTTAPTQLKSWRWNSRLTSDSLSLDKLAGFHLNSSFASLQKVAFVNYQLASWGLSARQQSSEEIERQNRERVTQLSACILALPNLEHLILESCTLVNGLLLDQLSTSLKHLGPSWPCRPCGGSVARNGPALRNPATMRADGTRPFREWRPMVRGHASQGASPETGLSNR